MPTAARIVAAICIAFVAWVGSGLVKLEMPAQSSFGFFVPLSVIVALACGWIILGRRADRGRLGFGGAIGVGLSAMAVAVFWVLFVIAAQESFAVAIQKTYHDPMKVIYGIYPIAGKYGATLLETTILVWLVFGGAISGILAHLAGQRWPGR